MKHFYSDYPWLTPPEREEMCQRLVHQKLMKWNDNRNFLLKNGSKSDIYINLRDARNATDAVPFIARALANALSRLNPDRFIEVPDSVTCFTYEISRLLLNKPYITIRPQTKEGRATDAKLIGECRRGETVSIYDDVITDGASKIPAYKTCLSRGLHILPLVVLVDRQQGWKGLFAREGINMDVWPGMTLHDVRRYLIEKGHMKRCDEILEEKNPLIVAHDGKSWEEILPLADRLRTSGCIHKVNDLLFNEGIKNLIPNLQVYGRVMADLKGHDIKNTLQNITKHLLPHPPWAVTVHGSGGKEMVEAVVKTLEGTGTKVLVVTVLTSIDPRTCEEIYNRLPAEEVRALAQIAHRAGAHGIVCSPEEVEELRKKYPEMTLVTPGIRPAGSNVKNDDQKRKATPAEAIAKGANYLVIGRPITEDAPDPYEEAMRILKEELEVL